ncbi:MAG: OsmC family protein [Anaerolineae bacterium]
MGGTKLTVEHVDGMRFLITAEKHKVVTDAAPEDGGGGTAMNAPGLFAAAVGACVLEFVLNSCRLHDVPVEQLSLTMTFDEVPGPRRIGALRASLRIEPEPPRSVKRRLVGVARHATLVNTLAHPPQLEVAFAGEQGGADADL